MPLARWQRCRSTTSKLLISDNVLPVVRIRNHHPALVLLGEPEHDGHTFAAGDEQQLVSLQSALTDMQNTPDIELFGAAEVPLNSKAAIDPATVLQLVMFVLSLIEKWRNR